MSKDFDEFAFHKQMSLYNGILAVILTAGGILTAASIAFLTTGVAKINDATSAQGSSQDRMLSFGFSFVQSGVQDLMFGLLIIISGFCGYYFLIWRLRTPVRSNDNMMNVQQLFQSLSSTINQKEEEYKNLKVFYEIEKIREELFDLKSELAKLKLEHNKK